MKRIVIKGGRVIDPAHEIDSVQDVYISEGKIVGLNKPPAGFTADQEITAKLITLRLLNLLKSALTMQVKRG
jgi:predicted amidohydrolase